jgi:hypothetical protein
MSLLLQEWDAQRGIVRRSVYAGFDADRKLEFLATLAFHLTFVIKAKTFSEAQLRGAYRAIHTSFELPREEVAQVVTELESHSGIIAVANLDRFEFAHLSMQEYLCGYYIVRDPFAKHIDEYLQEYPGPIAVAVTLASSPANWLSC